MINGLKRKFDRLGGELDERGRRWWAASEALELGRGGIKAVAEATGMGERTIGRCCSHLESAITARDRDHCCLEGRWQTCRDRGDVSTLFRTQG